QPPLDAVSQQFQAWSYIADNFALWKVNPLDIGGRVADMDHLRTFRAHNEGRLLDRIVPDGDDQVGSIDGFVDVVALAQRSRAHIEPASACDRTLAHLRGEERNLSAPDETSDSCRAARTRCRGTKHDQRALCLENHFSGS